MRAQQTLLTPRLRTEAEVGGFLDVHPSLAAEIVSEIRCGITLREIGERLEKLHSLPRSNFIAHYGSARPLELDDLCGLIEAQATVAAGAVCDAINDVRQEIALGRVDREAVGEALSKLMDRQTKAVIETLGFEDDAVAVFDEFVSEIVAGADSPTIFRLDVYGCISKLKAGRRLLPLFRRLCPDPELELRRGDVLKPIDPLFSRNT
jgi:hypothetical protein